MIAKLSSKAYRLQYWSAINSPIVQPETLAFHVEEKRTFLISYWLIEPETLAINVHEY